jgi:hypothetical protein
VQHCSRHARLWLRGVHSHFSDRKQSNETTVSHVKASDLYPLKKELPYCWHLLHCVVSYSLCYFVAMPAQYTALSECYHKAVVVVPPMHNACSLSERCFSNPPQEPCAGSLNQSLPLLHIRSIAPTEVLSNQNRVITLFADQRMNRRPRTVFPSPLMGPGRRPLQKLQPPRILQMQVGQWMIEAVILPIYHLHHANLPTA